MVIVMVFTSLVPVNIVPVLAASAPYPYNASYQYGLGSQADNQDEANDMVLAEWDQWKSQRITSSGAEGFRRVQRDGSTNYDTVSEGIGYGMLLAVYFDDKSLLDDLYRYARANFNKNGLMGWHLDANGNFTTSDGGSGAASDADQDMALALVFAAKKWGSGAVNYEQEARKLLDTIYNNEVEKGTYVFKPGDSWGGSQVTNPSYFAPAWYRVFAQFTGKTEWINVANKCYEMLDNCRKYNNNTGLIPDWCKADGTKADKQGYDFKYDAIRTPWRIAVDYSWYGTAKAKTICDDMSKFFKAGGISSIGDGYTITGSRIASNHTPSFVSMIASGAMTGYDETFAKEMYAENLIVENPVPSDPSRDYSYFGNCLRMLALLHTTGNFPNLYNYTPATPTPTPTPTLTPTPTPTPTLEPTEFNISGYIDAELSYSASVADSIKSGFKVEIESIGMSAITDSKGYFTITGVPEGRHTIRISKEAFLYREVISSYIMDDTQISTKSAPIKLWAGDMVINGRQDGAINMNDVVNMSKYFNTSIGDGKYDIVHDLNLDSAINMKDITLVAAHFNKTSADYTR